MKTENRRDFLKKTGVAAAEITLGGTAMSARSYRGIPGANERLNIAVIGCYRRAGALRSSYAALKDHMDVGYVCDVVKKRREDYKDIYFDYNWHWFWPWGTGETGNNATHEFDVARWVLQVDHPGKVFCNAGKYHFVEDDWTMYDNMDVTFLYPGGKSIRWDGKSRNNYKTYGHHHPERIQAI